MGFKTKSAFYLFFALAFFTESLWAQSFKVDKVRGKKAIIEILDGRFVPGETYQVDGKSKDQDDEFSDFESKGRPVAAQRARFINFGFGFQSGSAKVSGIGSDSVTDFDIDLLYGWNRRQFEYGPMFQYSSKTIANSTSSILAIGGFYDYNLVPHTNAREWIYGLTGRASLGSYKQGALSGNLFALLGGLSIKHYPFHPANFVIRADAGLAYQNRSTKPSQTYTALDFKIALGYYF